MRRTFKERASRLFASGLCTLLICLGLALSCRAAGPTAARVQIQGLYHKACEAAGLKFLLGMVSFRSPDFQMFAADGREVNVLRRAAFYRRLFARALSVHETAKVTSFSRLKGGSRLCQVVRELVAVLPAPRKKGKGLVRLVITTTSKDTWTSTPLGWMQVRSRILKRVWKRHPIPKKSAGKTAEKS